MDESRPAPNLPADTDRRLARAERIVACFRQALGHDLPNQLVALQGLLQILELEEGRRLSAEGQDYLHRLGGLTRRMQEALGTLKAIGRAALDTGAAEEIALADLAREAAAEVKQLVPGRAVTYHLRFETPAVRTYRRPLQRAVVELIRDLLLEADGEVIHLRLGSRPAADGVELWVGVWQGPPGAAADGPATAIPPAPAWEGDGAAGRLSLALVRELVDTWDGQLTLTEGPGTGKLFTLLVRPPQ